MPMLTNYIKIAWRNLLRHRTISLINIAGLSFSIAFCFLLFLFIRNEQSFDSFHRKKDRLFRLEMTDMFKTDKKPPAKHLFSFLTKADDNKNQLVFPLIVAPDMQRTFPEIKSITRLKDDGPGLVKVNNQVFKEPDILYTDDNFFRNFSFPLISGSPASVLSAKNNVVLSQSVARKYFGNKNPVGKTVTLITDSVHLFTVTGIAADAPRNSSLQYDLVLPLTANPDYEENISSRFNESNHMYLVELADGVSAEAFEQKMDHWVKGYFAEYLKDYNDADITHFHLYLRPLADCHYNISQGWGHYTNPGNIYELACLGIVILLIASLNYVLLTVSNAAARSQEVGVRKVMGAGKGSIVLQFWVETQVVVLIAVLAGVFGAWKLLPLFNGIMDSSLQWSDFSWKETGAAMLTLCIILGILAGYYPALLLARMRAVLVMKSQRTFKVNPRFSRILVIAQYTACIILMMAAYVINRQMQYVNNKDLGFDKDQVLMVENPTWDFNWTQKVRGRLSEFAQTEPSVLAYSGMNGGLDGSYNTNGFMLNGERKWLRQLTVDYDYFEMLGLPFVEGRSFSRNMAMDTSAKLSPSIVNETLFRMLGKTAKLGEYNQAIRSTIIGVVKDYHFESLSKQIEPEQHRLVNGYEGYFLFKIRAGKTREAIDRIGNEWKQITGNYPFEYTFLDESIAKMYKSDTQWQQIVRTSCLFAIFISCMGLFGLSAINAANRTKEIGIRKVLGAGVRDIVTLLSGNFLIMVVIALVIATPVSWWLMNNWLEDFAYRIHITWWMFGLVGLGALAIALVTVGIQAIRAAIANPVDSLKAE
jgi:putative ABC transport system permease protein